MKRVQQIWEHPVYQDHLRRILEAEKDRFFCRHTPDHFLDVARLIRIYAAEVEADISKEVIYSAALLHDIGRALQYEKNIPHDQASCRIAEKVLEECGFLRKEREEILDAIGHHRNQGSESLLGQLLYRADKASRLCFCCQAIKECNWSEEKKNMFISD